MSNPLETSAWGQGASESEEDWPSHPGYKIIEELGRGGMGVVYKAKETNSGRLVALKLIRDSTLASSEERARFRNEAEAAARVRHAHVVELYDVGECNGQPYLAMEFVDGGALSNHISGRAIPSLDAAEFVVALAQAVHAAHVQLVVHRDLKPANILMARTREKSASEAARFAQPTFAGWQPKIADFGLAKRLDGESTALTRAGAVLGSASYMAPEQAAGQTQNIGVAADVYALGAILYELLTGRPPFLGETWQQTVLQVLQDEPAPPSQLVPDVALDIESICLQCLEKDPSRRYVSAALLADDLQSFLQCRPISIRPQSEMERLRRLAARDGYTLVREIGTGPRSIVFQAIYDPLRQPVAIKVLSSSAFPAGRWEQYVQRTAERRSAITHPQILMVQRAGLWGATPFLHMEYGPHGSLATRMCEKPLTISQALKLAMQLAEVVGYLHRQGVIHGNLKPSNVLFAADGILRITDLFEASGLCAGEDSWKECAAAELAYLAPEVVRDAQRELLPPTDVYGLGLVLYELLARRPAFVASSTEEMLETVLNQEPAPPSRWNDQLPAELDKVCLRCLRTSPWRRYARAYDLQRRLRELLSSFAA